MGASAFSSKTLEAEKMEVNHVKITEEKKKSTYQKPCNKTLFPCQSEIHLRICKDSKDVSPTSSISKKDIKRSNQIINESV